MPSIGHPLPHDSAVGHVTGTATYIDDIRRVDGELAVDFAGSTFAQGTIQSIDRFTGDLSIDRVDLLMDVGEMINPGVDYGQMISGFIQGGGWVTNEELVYNNQTGELLSASPTTYKNSNVTDIPPVFHVDTIENPKHNINVRRSKAVGEPPLMLGISVWLAAKDAIGYLSPGTAIPLGLPATGEANLMCLTSLRASRKAVAS